MADRMKLIAMVFLVAILLPFAGCNESNTDVKLKPPQQSGEIKRIENERQKAKLLRKIDSKFENPEAHYELARLYQADALWAKAEYHYNNTLSFEPSHKDAQAGMIKVLLSLGDTSRAEILADIYANQTGNSAADSLLLALAYQQQYLDEHALAMYNQALRLAPNSAKINRQIGYYYKSKGDNVQARNYLTRSYQLDPIQPEVAGELGRMGVVVRIPRKSSKGTKKLDKIVTESDRRLTQ